ncbi:MAG: FHA domain-containing protein [Anaerolineae bacterium]|nr:FHA domain-containing protein [Anaerolineae bacterium]MDQ7036372.1 FHA domain-containing protein [Anaerolineae bacterium]
MSNYEKKEDVVTIFGRRKILPALDNNRNMSDDVPDTVIFELPDGKVVSVSTKQEIIIGRKPRDEDPDVTIDLEGYEGHKMGVSRHHALIKLFKDMLILVDLDSINGTFVNNRRALPTKRYAILDGDEITVGRLTLKVHYNR